VIAAVLLVSHAAPPTLSSSRPFARVATQQHALARVYFLLLFLRQGLYVDLAWVEAERRVLPVVRQILPAFLITDSTVAF
jgi:hypothetical protein